MPDDINNDIYRTLGDRWYTAQDDPVALLRAEHKIRLPWILKKIEAVNKGNTPQRILDLGCGGGLLSNALALAGHRVTGVDQEEECLIVARRYDKTKNIEYLRSDAAALPFSQGTFDVVCAMDFLEHVTDPSAVVREVARVLRPGGLFFFYTFNRNFLSRLVVIYGVEWFVKNTPPHLHIYKYFIKPQELVRMCEAEKFLIQEIVGLKPKIFTRSFLKLLTSGIVDENFSFELTPSTFISYLGMATLQSGN